MDVLIDDTTPAPVLSMIVSLMVMVSELNGDITRADAIQCLGLTQEEYTDRLRYATTYGSIYSRRGKAASFHE